MSAGGKTTVLENGDVVLHWRKASRRWPRASPERTSTSWRREETSAKQRGKTARQQRSEERNTREAYEARMLSREAKAKREAEKAAAARVAEAVKAALMHVEATMAAAERRAVPAAMHTHKKQAIEVVEVAAQIDTAVYLGTRSRSIPVAKKRKAETGGEQLSKKAALMRGQVAVGV
jgi:hypothetical protein